MSERRVLATDAQSTAPADDSATDAISASVAESPGTTDASVPSPAAEASVADTQLKGNIMYTLENVSKRYTQSKRQVTALKDVSLTIGQGQLVAIQGPTGGGKSTLLQMLGALDRPTSGRVTLGDAELSHLPDRKLGGIRAKEIGFVFQGFNLIPTLTAQENVETALEPLGISGEDRRRRALAALDSVGLADRASHVPGELSGGQQQRVAIARALVTQPTVLFADEPTGNLDSEAGAGVLRLLRDAVELDGQTTLMVTHDPRAAAIADRVLYLADGRVVADLSAPSEADILAVMKQAAAR